MFFISRKGRQSVVTVERLYAMVMDTKLRACIVERGASHENRIVKINVAVVAAFQILDQSLILFVVSYIR